METYGELKRKVPAMDSGELEALKVECQKLIADGIKPSAERDLLAHVESELQRRKADGLMAEARKLPTASDRSGLVMQANALYAKANKREDDT